MLQFTDADMLTGHWSKVKNMGPRLFSYSESFKDKISTIAPVWERDYTIDGVTLKPVWFPQSLNSLLSTPTTLEVMNVKRAEAQDENGD